MLPILYSFRRCPYAIRARLALQHCQQQVELREVVLKNKPMQMLQASPKGTVPVLVLPDGNIIDESLDIMLWAVQQNANGWQPQDNDLISHNDFEFKSWLDKYKYADRYPEHTQDYYRDQACAFLQTLNQILSKQNFIAGETIGFEDIAIAPFIRQYAFVDKNWFDQTPYPYLQQWLDNFLYGHPFNAAMQKYPQWQPEQPPTIFK